jgi:hypothetical protein
MLSNDTSFNNVIIIQPPINIQLENDTSSNKPINPFASTQRSNSNLVLYNPNTNSIIQTKEKYKSPNDSDKVKLVEVITRLFLQRKKRQLLKKPLLPRGPPPRGPPPRGPPPKDPPPNYPLSLINSNNIPHIPISKSDKILNKIRHNCVHLSIYHNKRYHSYKNTLFSVFRVPLILFAGCNSFIAVGMQNYLSQNNISIINALLSILCGVVTSIELLLNLQKRMETELDSYKSYYKLSIEIYKFIKLDPIDREETSHDFLPKIYEIYEDLITKGNAINVYRRGFVDEFEDVNDDIVITEIPDTWYNYFCHCCY